MPTADGQVLANGSYVLTSPYARTCQATPCGMDRASISCDEKDDCPQSPSSLRCCVGDELRTACQASCETAQLCKTDAECGNDAKCEAWKCVDRVFGICSNSTKPAAITPCPQL